MKYTVSLDNRELEIHKTEKGPTAVVEGLERHFQHLHGNGIQHIVRVDNVVHEVIDISDADADDGLRTLLVDGRKVELRLRDETMAAKGNGTNGSAAQAHKAAIVKAPMPGRIIAVLAQVGAELKKGDGIVTLEAMKLENEIKSPVNGILKALHVAVLDALEKNAVIAEIE